MRSIYGTLCGRSMHELDMDMDMSAMKNDPAGEEILHLAPCCRSCRACWASHRPEWPSIIDSSAYRTESSEAANKRRVWGVLWRTWIASGGGMHLLDDGDGGMVCELRCWMTDGLLKRAGREEIILQLI